MIFSNMAYPGKDYRVQIYDAWLGDTFEPMDNPKDGDKIVKRELGSDGQPVVSEELVYSGGEWVEGGGGGSTETVLYDGEIETVLDRGLYIALVSMRQIVTDAELPDSLTVVLNGNTYELPQTPEQNNTYGELDGQGTPSFENYPMLIAFMDNEAEYDGLIIATAESVSGTLKVSAVLNGGSVLLESLDVTENGDYYADEGTGWDEVHVAVVPSVSIGNLKLTNQTGVMLYAESFSVTDEALVSNTSEPIIISNNSTKNVAVPYASATTAYISFDLILKCATSAGDISNLVCTVTAPSSSVPGSTFSAIVHGTYRPSDPGDTNMRAVVHFYGFIPNGMVSEMSVTLTLS